MTLAAPHVTLAELNEKAAAEGLDPAKVVLVVRCDDDTLDGLYVEHEPHGGMGDETLYVLLPCGVLLANAARDGIDP